VARRAKRGGKGKGNGSNNAIEYKGKSGADGQG
jgi:hypothetical protein